MIMDAHGASSVCIQIKQSDSTSVSYETFAPTVPPPWEDVE